MQTRRFHIQQAFFITALLLFATLCISQAHSAEFRIEGDQKVADEFTATSATVTGNLTVNGNISGDGSQLTNVDADTLDGNTPSAFSQAGHGHNLQDLSGTATDSQIPDLQNLSGAVTDSQVPNSIEIDNANNAYTANNANNAYQLGSYWFSDYPRKSENAAISGQWSFSAIPIRAEQIWARDSSGINILEDDGNWGIRVTNSGTVGIGNNNTPAAGCTLDVVGQLRTGYIYGDDPSSESYFSGRIYTGLGIYSPNTYWTDVVSTTPRECWIGGYTGTNQYVFGYRSSARTVDGLPNKINERELSKETARHIISNFPIAVYDRASGSLQGEIGAIAEDVDITVADDIPGLLTYAAEKVSSRTQIGTVYVVNNTTLTLEQAIDVARKEFGLTEKDSLDSTALSSWLDTNAKMHPLYAEAPGYIPTDVPQSINWTMVIPVNVRALQAHEEEIQTLTAKNAELEARVAALEQAIANIQANLK